MVLSFGVVGCDESSSSKRTKGSMECEVVNVGCETVSENLCWNLGSVSVIVEIKRFDLITNLKQEMFALVCDGSVL